MHELNKTYSQIGKASAIIFVITLIDKLLAVAKEIVVANHFGISAALDVFNIALCLPSLIVLIFSGALVSAFVPLYLEWSRLFSPKQVDAHVLTLILLSVLFFSLLTAFCYFSSPFLFSLIGIGFGPEQKKLGVILEKLLVFVIIVDGAGIILTALLQAQKKFFNLQAAPLFINTITIIMIALFQRSLGIYTLAWGLLLGTFCKVIFMAAVLNRGGFSFTARLKLDWSIFTPFVFLALPLLGTALIANVNFLVDMVMATGLSSGSVSSLRYAFRIYDLPVQIMILAISKAIFPFISELKLDEDFQSLRNIFKHSVIFLGFLTFPIICIVFLFSEEVVGILFQRGAFDTYATQQTAQILLFYSLGLFFYAYAFINGVFFKALKDNKPLFYMGCLAFLLNILFNFIFMHIFGVKGIALSTTFTLGIVSLSFIFLLKQRLAITELSPIPANFSRITVASVCMFGSGFLLDDCLASLGLNRILHLSMIVILMVLCYLLVIWLIRTKELDTFFNYFKNIVSLRRL